MSRALFGHVTCLALLIVLAGCAGASSASPTAPAVATRPTPASTVVTTVAPLATPSPEPTAPAASTATATAAPDTPTVAPAPTNTAVVSTATAESPPAPTATKASASPTPTTTTRLTVDQIAATAVAESVGEQCVATPPKPAKGFVGDSVRGKMLYNQRGCINCHGEQAQGNVGPKLAGTTLTFEAVIHQLREPRGVMQRYLPKDQSDADECDVYIYVKNLKP